jgi:hypothetical protein
VAAEEATTMPNTAERLPPCSCPASALAAFTPTAVGSPALPPAAASTQTCASVHMSGERGQE